MVGGDPEWAHELRRQLMLEIRLVGSGQHASERRYGASSLHDDAADAASERINGLQRRLEQVDRLIDAIEALEWRH